MNYIYKLVDEFELEYAKKGIISLSKPIFEFKGSEGKMVYFIKKLFDKYKEQKMAIKPTEKELDKISEWINIYDSTYCGIYTQEDIVSETMIIFCGIIQGYCGYFTMEDLTNPEKYELFTCKEIFKNKIGVIKLNEEVVCKTQWNSNNINETFSIVKDNKTHTEGNNGISSLLEINYTDAGYDELIKKFNSTRDSNVWFDNIPTKYAWQKEKRIIFRMRSIETNSSTIGSPHTYKMNSYSREEAVYCNTIDALAYNSNSPKYIYLNVGTDNIKIITGKEILGNRNYAN